MAERAAHAARAVKIRALDRRQRNRESATVPSAVTSATAPVVVITPATSSVPTTPVPVVITTPTPVPVTSRSVVQTTVTTVTQPDPVVVTSLSQADSDTVVLPSRTTSSTASLLETTSSAIVTHGSTSFVTNIVTVGPSLSASASASAAPSTGGSGPSAGVVVGIVAGGLVGIVVIAGLIAHFFKSKFGKDEDDDVVDNVFNKGDFRRESVMLQDDEFDRMSMRSGSAAGTLSVAGGPRSANALPGIARNGTGAPRPPSTLERHYLNAPGGYNSNYAALMPSFQPGQIVNTNFYTAPQSNYAASDGGWGVAASYGQPQPTGTHLNAPQQAYYNQGGLDRNASMASRYADDYTAQPQAQYHNDGYPPMRSGTPENDNMQQTYFRDSGESGGNRTQAKGQRTLSIRNHGAYDDDAYAGI